MSREGDIALDIAVVTKKPKGRIVSPILICPAEKAVELAKKGQFEQIVTVGYSSGDTVTFSSMDENTLSVCFTRGIIPVFGDAIPPGEVVLESCCDAMNDMLVSAALRCIGVV